jgi:hypothetical protein
MKSAVTNRIGQRNVYVHYKEKKIIFASITDRNSRGGNSKKPHYRLNVEVMLIINVRKRKA